MTNRRFSEDGEPRSEPEIIPPGRTDIREAQSEMRRRLFEGEQSFHRIYVAKSGPFGLLPFFLLAGVIAAVFLVFVLWCFLILLPCGFCPWPQCIITGMLHGRSR